MSDHPLLVGEIVTFESAAAVEAVLGDLEELGGFTVETVGAPPKPGTIEVQFAIGEQVHPDRHQARIFPAGEDQIALNFRKRVSAGQALRQLPSMAAAAPPRAAPAPATVSAADIGLEPVAEPAAEASGGGVVILIDDFLTFDSPAAVNAFLAEVEDDGGAVVDALSAPDSGQVALGLSLAGESTGTLHSALAMASEDDQVGLMFEDPTALAADLRRLLGGGAAPVAASAEDIGLELVADSGGPKGPSLGLDADDLAVDGISDDLFAAALAEVSGGGAKAPTKGGAPAKPKPKVPKSNLPPPMPEEAEAKMGGAIVNPTSLKQLLAVNLADTLNPKEVEAISVFELLLGLNKLRETGGLYFACGGRKFDIPYLGGTFFANEDEVNQLMMAARERNGRWALVDRPSESSVMGRVKREPRPMVSDLLRRLLHNYDLEQLQAGLSEIKYKYATTVQGLNYTALGLRFNPKETLFLSDVVNGSRALGELPADSGMDHPQAFRFIYLCVIYGLVSLSG